MIVGYILVILCILLRFKVYKDTTKEIHSLPYMNRSARLSTGKTVNLYRPPSIIDGKIVHIGDRILLRGQKDKRSNGIYIVSSVDSWDIDDTTPLNDSSFIWVEEGIVNGRTLWSVDTIYTSSGVIKKFKLALTEVINPKEPIVSTVKSGVYDVRVETDDYIYSNTIVVDENGTLYWDRNAYITSGTYDEKKNAVAIIDNTLKVEKHSSVTWVPQVSL